jgi:LmbE family N-acetylglucosaminyl deacetylase
MCYGEVAPKPERGAQRRSVIENYPLSSVEFCDLPEPGKVSAEADLELRLSLADRLRDALRGVTTVFTHNAWGEYGHKDHRRVNGAIMALQGEMKFAVYVSCYLGRGALDAFESAMRQGVTGMVSFPIDRAVIDPVCALYKTHSCWTWAMNWSWSSEEHFFLVRDDIPIRDTTIPINFICQ